MCNRGQLLSCGVSVLVLVILAGGCSSPSAAQTEPTFIIGEGPVVRGRNVRIDQVRSAPEASAITVLFIGGKAGDIMANPCDTDYELEVDNGTSPMTITIWQLVPSVLPRPAGSSSDVVAVCTAEGHQRELHHQWSEADPPTQVLDGSNGETLPVIVVTRLLAPDGLPPGWIQKQSDAPPEPNAQTTRLTDGTYTAFIRSTLHADPGAVLEVIRTGPDFTEIVIRGGIRAEVSMFEGRPQLRFVDGSYLYQLSADQEVEPDVLLAVAEGMN